MRKTIHLLLLLLTVTTLSSCFYRGTHKPLIGGIREYKEAPLHADDRPSAQPADDPSFTRNSYDDDDLPPSADPSPSADEPLSAYDDETDPETSPATSLPAADRDARLEIPVLKINLSEQILHRKGYTTSYNADHRIPNWTAWHLLGSHVTGPYKRKGISYREDEEVPLPRATTFDYQQSGYDRGHMCPSGDNKWDAQAQQDCFLLTNMCPQNHNLNGGDWNELEMKCRKWAEHYGDIYIVCGPILYRQKHKTIGRSRIVVPEAFYKVVLRLSPQPAAIGFIYKNEDGNRPMGDYINTVRQVERITGVDFFPQLPDELENRVEKQASLDDWR